MAQTSIYEIAEFIKKRYGLVGKSGKYIHFDSVDYDLSNGEHLTIYFNDIPSNNELWINGYFIGIDFQTSKTSGHGCGAKDVDDMANYLDSYLKDLPIFEQLTLF